MPYIPNEDYERMINLIKNNTDLCDTFCCYEDCENCVTKYLQYLADRGKLE